MMLKFGIQQTPLDNTSTSVKKGSTQQHLMSSSPTYRVLRKEGGLAGERQKGGTHWGGIMVMSGWVAYKGTSTLA